MPPSLLTRPDNPCLARMEDISERTRVHWWRSHAKLFFGLRWLQAPESADHGQSEAEALGPGLDNGKVVTSDPSKKMHIGPQLLQEDFDTQQKLCVNTHCYLGRDIAIGIFKFCSNIMGSRKKPPWSCSTLIVWTQPKHRSSLCQKWVVSTRCGCTLWWLHGSSKGTDEEALHEEGGWAGYAREWESNVWEGL